MALPASLVTAVEQHSCFTGCYRHESPIDVCVDPTMALVPMVHVSCGDCLSFRVGALTSTLASGMTSYALADALTAHMRTMRGFEWTVSGYHAIAGGFWLSAASYGTGVYLVDASRNRNGQSDVDVLIEAFKHKVVPTKDPRMIDPSLYAADVLYLNLALPVTPVYSKQDILSSTQASAIPKPGFRRVAVVEFLPLVGVGTPDSAETEDIPEEPPVLSLGDRCPKCGAIVMERPLFSGTFIGCLC